MRRTLASGAAAILLAAGCTADAPEDEDVQTEPASDDSPVSEPDSDSDSDSDSEPTPTEEPVSSFDVVEHAQFESPWAMEFLPDTDLLLITERTGNLLLRDQASGEVSEISGIPDVVSAGQGGLHDVIAGPAFAQDQTIYLSWVREAGSGSHGVVGRAQLDTQEGALEDLEVLWEQDPADGDGHFALRILIHEDLLYVTSGDRQELQPAQDVSNNLGSIVRLDLDGEAAADNPFADDEGASPDLWTIGHRNPLGIALDSAGNLWSSEMGPEGGDELNLIQGGQNYGWPEVSMGVHYDGTDIPDHTGDDEFTAPAASWVPAISPGNLLIYSGDLFTGWQDSALLGGLSGQNLVRVELDDEAEPVDEWDMGARIRAIAEASDGALWIATDDGDLLELRPED